jgi:hypothetical protein
MNPTDPLAQLKDIHLPEAVSWWPPAPGWWGGTAVVLALLLWAAWRGVRYWRKTAYKRAALRELKQLRRRGGQPQQLLTDLSVLLRRVALAAFPAEEVASLHGKDWLAFLDRSGQTQAFSRGVGHYLAAAPYAPDLPNTAGQDLDVIWRLARDWIRRQ